MESTHLLSILESQSESVQAALSQPTVEVHCAGCHRAVRMPQAYQAHVTHLKSCGHCRNT